MCVSAAKHPLPPKAPWAIHAFKRHGRMLEARNLVSGSQCPACHKEFHQHVRLLRHVTSSRRCRLQLQGEPAPAHRTPGQGSKQHVAEMEASHVRPVIQAEGPARDTLALQRMERLPKSLSGFQDAMHVLLLDVVDGPWHGVSDLLEQLRLAIRQATMHPDEIATFVSDWIHDLRLCDGHDRCEEIAAALKDLCQCLSVEWVFPNETWYRAPVAVHGRTDLDARFADLERFLRTASLAPSPPIRGRQTVFLHIFSGHRRPGDLQEAVERAGLHPELPGVALSVDIVIEEMAGNLLRRETWQNLVKAFESGLITATSVGPPCETVSKARSREIFDEKGRRLGPRPIRSRQEPAGLSKLNQRELEQVITANQLWGATLNLFVVALANGAVALIEHPATPREEEAASLWRLPAVKALLRHERVQLVTVLQGLYGGKSPKPTSFLLANAVDNPEEVLAAGRSCSQLPTAIQAGKNAKGEYHTAQLKEYPRALCDAIAELMRLSVKRRSIVTEEERHDAFDSHPELQLLHAALSGGPESCHARGPDFNPHGYARARAER